ncbi:MAG: hypothetical protein AB7G93_18035 [Bdellovibrionales bacterium]
MKLKKTKLSLVLALLSLTSFAASATSLYMGPWLSLEVGKEGQNANWKRCSVWPGSVTMTVNGVSSHKETNISDSELADAIARANQEEVQIALHVRAADPAVVIWAGDPPEIPQFELYHDASRLEYRSGPAAEYLIEQVRELCNGLDAD